MLHPTSTVLHSPALCPAPRSLSSGWDQCSWGGRPDPGRDQTPHGSALGRSSDPLSDSVSSRTRRTGAGGAASAAGLSSPAHQGDSL